jgi:hypothetical protein
MTDYSLHERARRATHIAKYLAAHPREARMMPRWYRERASSPFELRRPWWPYPVPGFLRRSLPPAPRAFEFGTGGSTLWLEDLGATITSVEHDSSWYELVRTHVGPAADVILRAPRAGGRLYSEVDDHSFDEYVAAIDGFPPGSFDLVVVDGRCRVAALTRSIEKVKPGGFLLLDDSERARYGEAESILRAWPAFRFQGLRPGGGTPSQTTCWRRPQP